MADKNYKIYIKKEEPANVPSGSIWIDASNGEAYIKIRNFVSLASPLIPFTSQEKILFKKLEDSKIDNLGQLYYSEDTNNTWNISQGVELNNTNLTNPRGIFLAANQQDLYIIENNGTIINQYFLSVAGDISTKTFIASIVPNQGNGTIIALVINSNRDRMYVLTISGAYQVYTLTNGDLATGNLIYSAFLELASQNLTNMAILGNGDLYIINATTIYQHYLGNTIIGYTGFSYNFQAQELQGRGVYVRPGDDKVYIVGTSSSAIHEYDLPTNFVSSAIFVQSHSLAVTDTSPYGLSFLSNGEKFYITGTEHNKLYSFLMSGSLFSLEIYLDDWQNIGSN